MRKREDKTSHQSQSLFPLNQQISQHQSLNESTNISRLWSTVQPAFNLTFQESAFKLLVIPLSLHLSSNEKLCSRCSCHTYFFAFITFCSFSFQYQFTTNVIAQANPCLHFILIDICLSLADEANRIKSLNIERLFQLFLKFLALYIEQFRRNSLPKTRKFTKNV